MANLSTFPNAYDNFITLADLPADKYAEAQELKNLMATSNKNSTQTARMNELMIELQNYYINPDIWNKLCDCIKNMELFTFEQFTSYYKYCGDYNNSTTYKIFNTVRFTDNDMYLLYNATSYYSGIDPTNETYWLKIFANKESSEYAITQGNYALEQGTYAKNQGDYAKAEGDRIVNTFTQNEADRQSSYETNELIRNNQFNSNENERINEFNMLKADSITATNNAIQATTNANTATANYTDVVEQTKKIYKPMVNTYADILTTYPTPEIGWTVVAKDTHIEYRWDGFEWVDIGVNDAFAGYNLYIGSTAPTNPNLIWLDAPESVRYARIIPSATEPTDLGQLWWELDN